MRADTNEEAASSSWMNIRFDHALVPQKEEQTFPVTGGAVYLEAENGHPALDRHMQLSRTGRRHS